ncbi:AAA domain-containing protein [Ditylenchus destructor]|uniref:AAA domain-containing protein n=1 Tax=Ditylenchus destructor TaxID=166010 RepID=A0AAD4NGF0_9BILA|nr:AAA domain-containing protein [Ditylenchus destructor]KAI1728935.1 AAA domain-containing protein [Ditylenchus destructor]
MPKRKVSQAKTDGPDVIMGREAEFQQIENLLQHSLNAKDTDEQILSIYVNGIPGTGKTLTIKSVVKKLQKQRKKFDFMLVDCFEFGGPAKNRLYRKILENLYMKPVGTNALSAQLDKVFLETDNRILIVLDEIDNLQPRLLYSIFAWPAKSNGKVILIGIANSLDMMERTLPKLKTILPPKVITFAPYTQKQLTTILERKLVQIDSTLDSKAIELCVRKVLAVTGDVRRAMDVAKQIVESLNNGDDVDDENTDPTPVKIASVSSPGRHVVTPSRFCTPTKTLKRPAPGSGIAGDGTPSKNACREVLRVIKKVRSSPLERYKLPLHPRIMVATIMRILASSLENTSSTKRMAPMQRTTKAKLYTAYFTVCEHLKFQPLASEELDSVYTLLESQSIISVNSGKGTVAFEVEDDMARQLINDDKLLNSIESIVLR